MKSFIAATAIVLAVAAPASAFNLGGTTNTNINNQQQGQAQVQGQSQEQSQGQSNSNNVRVSTPEFTYGAFVSISSMANDSCGRVALGIPYSAHTCNVLLEAAAMEQMLTPSYGAKKAAQAAIMHVVYNDRTMRETLTRMGIVRIAN
jgi:hypothetical protein